MAGLKPILALVGGGGRLSAEQSEEAFSAIMDGEASQVQIAALVTALHVRGETVEELLGAMRAMRARMLRVSAPDGAMDVCGTGGDGVGTLNVSTAVAFVLAGCGVPVAKHGNRALTSRAGGSDVLAALGVAIDQPVASLERQMREVGIAFLFAPLHHPALRHAASVRSEIGFRTVFNLLGPLCNPAGVRRQLTGVFDPAWLRPMTEALGASGTELAWLVHGQGLDEMTTAGETMVCEWRRGEIRQFLVTPEMAGLPRAPVDSIRGGDAAQNAASLLALLQGADGPYRDTVLLNAAAALMVAERVASLHEGVSVAAAAVDGGAARHVLESILSKTAESGREHA
jgi:anthranilate phosphoribosyltransferase/anthranilate synthase/phosphoribosyltransferase